MTIDARELRNAFGRFATGVCVITANPPGTAPFGMTVNSFSSVSLTPPLLLWNLQNDSDCFQAFESADAFAVNVLSAAQKDLSGQCARKGEHALPPDSFQLGASGLPVVKGALASFECRVWARYPGGDHVILVGEVQHMVNSMVDEPLLFWCGQYRGLSAVG